MIFFGLRQAVEDCPPILRVLDTKKHIVGTHRSRKHNLQHPYAPKFAVFHEKKGHKWPFSGHILIFFGFVQAVEGSPPPILRVLDAKKQVVCTHGLRKHGGDLAGPPHPWPNHPPNQTKKKNSSGEK